MTSNRKKRTIHPSEIRTTADVSRLLPRQYVKHNPRGGIEKAMQQPNFVKRRRKAPDGHEILEIDYT